MAGREEPEATDLGPEARLGISLRRARERRGISLRALARRLYRAHSTLVEYERGHRLAPIEVVKSYEAELGIATGTLVALHEAARLELYGENRSHREGHMPGSTADAPHQLPPDIAGFTGRKAELGNLRARVAERAAGTVVISAIAGTAGVGKTALAVHLAHELAADFCDVQLYVNLHGYEPAQRFAPTQVLDRFLRALGVPPDVLPSDLEEQVARYRGLLAGRRALVVLDNACSAEQVRPLLPASSTCLVLITSRDCLAGMVAAEGAQLLILDVLTSQEALELLAGTAGSGRVKAEPEAAAEVVRLCGYLPLAVRIAGARLATRPRMSLAALAGRLLDERRRLGELSAGEVEVRASFAFSYQSLAPDAARAFRRLGLVPGRDFAPGVAAALTDVTLEEAEKLLEVLVDAHLVEMASTPGRYRFHDLLRLYAREQAQAEETDEDRESALRRTLEWYLDMADAAEALLVPGRRRFPYERTGHWEEPDFTTLEQALAWFEAERISLVAATHEAAKCGLHSIVWQLSDAMFSFFYLRSYWADCQDVHRAGLAAAREARDRRAQTCMMSSLGMACSELHEFDDALELCQGSVAISRELGDRERMPRGLLVLGRVLTRLQHPEEAVEYLQQALAMCREIGYAYGAGVAVFYLGMAYQGLGRFEEAISCEQEALAIYQQFGDRRGEAMTLHNLGQVYCHLCRFEEAIECEQRSLALAREVGYRWGEGGALELLGLALQHTRGRESARECWHEALRIFTEIGAPEADGVRDRLADSSL